MDEARSEPPDEEDVVTQSSERNAAIIQQLQAISPESVHIARLVHSKRTSKV